MEFKDEVERETSEFMFGYVEVRTNFQRDVVRYYARMCPLTKKVTDTENVACLLETAYAIQTFCRRWDVLKNDEAKGFQERLIWSTVRIMKAHVSYVSG